MMVNEFIVKVADGEINSIDIRKFFVGLSDLDKSDLLQDMFIESLAEGLSGHNSEEQRLADAINMLCDVFGWYYESDMKEYIHKPTQEPEQAGDLQTTGAQSLNPEPQQAEQELKYLLPEQLKSVEAINIFQKGIDANLIEKKNNALCWKDSKQLLAYFAEKISNRFSLTNRVDKDGKKYIDWKTFETIFNVKGLKNAKQNWMRLNTRFEPTGYEKVDALM